MCRDSSSPSIEDLVLCIIFMILAGFVGFTIGVESTERAFTAKAIEAGVGEFVIIDPSDGDTEFQFKK